jgi:hypothetical protein
MIRAKTIEITTILAVREVSETSLMYFDRALVIEQIQRLNLFVNWLMVGFTKTAVFLWSVTVFLSTPSVNLSRSTALAGQEKNE